MLVYGDAARDVDPRRVLARLRTRLAGLHVLERAIERHAQLAAAFILAAELLQGLADADMDARGGDGRTPTQAAATALVQRLAEALLQSWAALGAGDAAAPAASEPAAALDVLEGLPLPRLVRLKAAEGYAFYALYPESYAEAARRLGQGLGATVIGVRSIGAGLAALVAAALQVDPPVSVRPVGHPFQRTLRLRPELEAEWRERVDGGFVIVDEGPGLSGSSFGAVADRLEALGVDAERIAFLPGHGGELGPHASAAHRARWSRAERPCVDFDAMVLDAAESGHGLASWFEDLTDGAPATLRDVSGGRWRAQRYAGEADWPAVDTFQERRKVLLETAGGMWLLKFVGLGETGERAFDHASRLASAGFTPKPAALRYGFMAEPWQARSGPLRARPQQRRAFVEHLGRYLGWRAANLPAAADAGADMGALAQMTRVNAVEALGERAASAAALDPGFWSDAPALRRVWTDNRLHGHEWLEHDGGWLKTDAVDHAAAHDLIGAQDIVWDVAGARVEFDLDAAETSRLLGELARQAPVDAALLRWLEPAYLAFQLGAFILAAQAHGGWPEEQGRLERAAARYRHRLVRLLQIA